MDCTRLFPLTSLNELRNCSTVALHMKIFLISYGFGRTFRIRMKSQVQLHVVNYPPYIIYMVSSGENPINTHHTHNTHAHPIKAYL